MATGGPGIRQLEWEGCLNVRDLGGYPAANGRETRWGAVVRSDNLSPLTDAGREALRDHGIRSIIDLRMPEEAEQLPNPFARPGDHGIAYTNVSQALAGALGGTSVLIAVGVALDTMRQMESQMMMRSYEGFLK